MPIVEFRGEAVVEGIGLSGESVTVRLPRPAYGSRELPPALADSHILRAVWTAQGLPVVVGKKRGRAI